MCSACNREVTRRFDDLQQILQIYERGGIGRRQETTKPSSLDMVDFEQIVDAIRDRNGARARQVLSSQPDRLAGLVLGMFIDCQPNHSPLVNTVF